ncbi:hypothetical protein [Nisaea sp.]|uniref:hypothetical protein n=1 Tax=Nisaea sp. TaxID=2024842 RepID=UPI003B519E63
MTVKVSDRGEFVEFIASGFVRPEDVFDAVSAYYEAVPKPWAVWNFLNADLSSFSADQFRKVAANGARFAAARGDDARSAIVVKSDAEAMLIRAFVAMAGVVSPIPFRIFMDRDDAIRWLRDPNRVAGVEQNSA